MYEALKWLHVASVAASGAGFLARGALMLADSPLLRMRVVRVVPHIIDTVLLASAIALAVLARLSPLQHTWLATKIIALLLYILLGTVALKRGRTRRGRATAFAAAVAVFAYIVSVALQRDALWLLR